MMSNFNRALEKTLFWEGGLSDNKNDRGGLTYKGISLRFLQIAKLDINIDGVINKSDILEIQDQEVIDIYKKYFWDKLKCDNIKSFYIQRLMFDIGVNSGNKQAVKIVQKCCNTLGCNIIVDGLIGKNTLRAINSCNEYVLNNLIVDERKKFYNKLALKDNNKVFINGWLNRSEDFRINNTK